MMFSDSALLKVFRPCIFLVALSLSLSLSLSLFPSLAVNPTHDLPMQGALRGNSLQCDTIF